MEQRCGRRAALLFCIALSAAGLLPLSASARGLAAATPERQTVLTDSPLVSLIQQLAQAPQLDAATVARLLATTLQRADDPSNPYLQRFVATMQGNSPVERIELRLPDDASRRGQALLTLTLRADRTVTIGELRARFGPPSNIEGPRATAPHGTPTYEVRDLPWGRLSFGYLPAAGDAVREVIFDRPAARAPGAVPR